MIFRSALSDRLNFKINYLVFFFLWRAISQLSPKNFGFLKRDVYLRRAISQLGPQNFGFLKCDVISITESVRKSTYFFIVHFIGNDRT